MVEPRPPLPAPTSAGPRKPGRVAPVSASQVRAWAKEHGIDVATAAGYAPRSGSSTTPPIRHDRQAPRKEEPLLVRKTGMALRRCTLLAWACLKAPLVRNIPYMSASRGSGSEGEVALLRTGSTRRCGPSAVSAERSHHERGINVASWLRA